MAATGYTPISIYYSTTASTAPTAGNLVNGELAINITDGKIFYKDNAGVVQVIGTKGGVGTSTTTQVLYNSSGLVVGSANMVFDGSTLTTLNLAYTGTLTGGTGVVNLGSGQFYKDASGNVGIGTASPTQKLAVKDATFSATVSASFANNNNGVYVRNSGSTTSFIGDSTGANNSIAFDTTGYVAVLTNNGTERMRILSSGAVLVGCTSNPSSTVAGKEISAYFQSSCGTTTTTYQHFYFTNGNGNVGTITTNGSLTSYNVSSDRRLKENIAPLTSGLSTVLNLKPSQYNYIADPEEQIQGFIADELQEIVPHAVNGEKNAVDKDGKPIYQGVDASFLIPFLVSAIQELNAKVTALETQLSQPK